MNEIKAFPTTSETSSKGKSGVVLNVKQAKQGGMEQSCKQFYERAGSGKRDAVPKREVTKNWVIGAGGGRSAATSEQAVWRSEKVA